MNQKISIVVPTLGVYNRNFILFYLFVQRKEKYVTQPNHCCLRFTQQTQTHTSNETNWQRSYHNHETKN